MSVSELQHHQNQMEAARMEFAQYFKPNTLHGLAKHEAARIEMLCWQFFLHGKGLKK